MTDTVKRVVLAYSGGLDTSVVVGWLAETYGCEVVAFCADLGQGEELTGIAERARAAGASRVYVEDLREEFARDYVFPMLRANALYEGAYLLGTAIARPLIARRQVEIARRDEADAVAHGATGKGNDQVRFELTYAALAPGLKVIAPWRVWEFRSRSDLIAYSQRRGIAVPVTQEKPYSVDRNLLHVSYEGGVLEDPWREPYEDMFLLTVSPEQAPDKAEYVEIAFEGGDAVSVNGEGDSPARLIARLNEVAARHGVGRADLVENRYVGMKSRGVYETPGGTVLHAAHRAVESLTLDREVMHLRDSLVSRYAEMIYYGYWFSPEREMLQAAIDACQRPVSGLARVKLYKGSCAVVGRKAERSLYDPGLATFEEGGGYRQGDADGFIRLNALRLRLQALAKKRVSHEG